MRHVGAALLAIIGLNACTEPGRQVLAPTAATNCRDATVVTADTVLNYTLRPGAFPVMVTRSRPTLPKNILVGGGNRIVAASFTIDTSGRVIGPSVQIETPPWPEVDQVVCDWLRLTQFEPVRRGGRPVRAAVRNFWGSITSPYPKPD
jgi:hypothetical protein